MRAGLCTVSAPLAACSPAGALPPAARFLALHLLHQQTLYFVVQAKSRVRELYQQTCLHFAQQGMLDTNLFGLALICDGEYLFAELDSKLSKYAPKSWKSSHSHGLDANGRPALAFYFRVQFYVDSPLLLQDETTRHHYYRQLQLNSLSRAAAGDHSIRLAGLALQTDVGDEVAAVAASFRPEDYLPAHMREAAAVRALENAHRCLRSITKSEARARFISEACKLEQPVNAHVFRLRAAKHEVPPGGLLLAVCPRGLRVCPENNPPSLFLWSSISKLSFERKRFEIRTGHEKLTLYTSSDEKSRLLLALCKAAHQFSMAVAPRLNEVRKEEAEELRRWDGDQRVSVISSTSSNTTSGIVSDRVHSEDELEIMITSPPALHSTESLALAHLLDSAPASSRTSTDVVGVALLGHANDEEELPSESSAGKAGMLAGSQCSSTCSTVVLPASTMRAPTTNRRPSTSSSLELGYSHTAQNSIVSDSTLNTELGSRDDAVYTCGGAAPPSSHTSGVYTLSSSDQVDGFRDRSNSNVSNSGSFRGDGSDPIATHQQTLLSAEELSDLIVGRYPSYKSVSNTLDSDSDYVTLPSTYQGYVPIPPVRVDSIEALRLRPPPPPYPDISSATIPTLPSPSTLLPSMFHSEEAGARFITTRTPNMLKAHTTLVTSTSSPSYTSIPPIPPKQPRSIITPANYLDVSASKATTTTATVPALLVPCTLPPPPPPPQPRQPPPPPPVFTSQLSRSQIEQYQQQMYSDVDFVVFPLKEPAISKQEYLEAKQGSLLAALAQQSMFYHRPYMHRYASSQNLSDTYVQLPVYSAPSIASTNGSLDALPPPPPPPLPPHRNFLRARSDDNILNTLDLPATQLCMQPPKFRRLPPPPPPPPERIEKIEKALDKIPETPAAKMLDIRTLREKSKKMDLPLIAALCNDRSLIKQTKAFVMPKHPLSMMGECKSSSAARSRFPVSGLSDAKMANRKPVANSSHRHPADKLPEIPRATPNNYVMTDPRAKHKALHSMS